MNVGEKIQYLRKSKNLTQEELAEVLNISRQALSKWENSTTNPDLQKMVMISEYFEVSTDYLMKDNCTNNNSTLQQKDTKRIDGKIAILTSTVLVLIGLIIAISMASYASWSVWYFLYPLNGYGLGVVIQLVGVGLFYWLYIKHKESKYQQHVFWLINTWLLTYVPSTVLLRILFDTGILYETFGITDKFGVIIFHASSYVGLNISISLFICLIIILNQKKELNT